MALQPNDLVVVSRNGTTYQTTVNNLLEGAGGGVTVSETAPSNPIEGQLWWADTDINEGGGRLYVWTGDEWVDISLPGGGGSGGTSYWNRNDVGGFLLPSNPGDDIYSTSGNFLAQSDTTSSYWFVQPGRAHHYATSVQHNANAGQIFQPSDPSLPQLNDVTVHANNFHAGSTLHATNASVGDELSADKLTANTITTNSYFSLSGVAATGGLRMNTANKLDFHWNNGFYYAIDNNNYVLINTEASDAKLKTINETTAFSTSASDIVLSLQPKRFEYTQDTTLSLPTGERYGFIAQELQQVLPEAVQTCGMPESETGEEYLALSTDFNSQMIAVLTKALQEALARIEQLEADHAQMMNNNGGSY